MNHITNAGNTRGNIRQSTGSSYSRLVRFEIKLSLVIQRLSCNFVKENRSKYDKLLWGCSSDPVIDELTGFQNANIQHKHGMLLSLFVRLCVSIESSEMFEIGHRYNEI